MMKGKFKFKATLLFLSLLLVYSCEDNEINIPLQAIEINSADFLIGIDEVKQLLVKASPSNATQNVTWETSNEDIAEIQYNTSGLIAGVKGVSLGSATLTAKSEEGALMQSINVQVIIKVEKIELVEEPINDPSQTKYSVIFTPADATFQTVTWSSSDSSVISVLDGTITAVSPGVAVITATSTEGSKTASVELATSGSNPTILGLEYCSVSGTGGYNVAAVKTTGGVSDIDYTGGALVGNYELIEDQSLKVNRGSTFNLAVKNGNGWSRTIVWIDWNGDLDFNDANERLEPFSAEEYYSGDSGETYNKDITVPSDAYTGNVRIRVLSGDAWTYNDASIPENPCGILGDSCIKDFKVTIL